jgi:hypothetical protein
LIVETHPLVFENVLHVANCLFKVILQVKADHVVLPNEDTLFFFLRVAVLAILRNFYALQKALFNLRVFVLDHENGRHSLI